MQVVDPAVSRSKFDREIQSFEDMSAFYRSRGWFIVDAAFPRVVVVMAAAHIRPPALVFAVEFDYSNYDFDPPSVRFVDPFTGKPLKASEVPGQLWQAVPMNGPVPSAQLQPLLQNYGPNEVPFLCIPGVLEYHRHPGHSGDDWGLHRRSGAGSLVRLLTVIHEYGVEAISGYNVAMVVNSFRVKAPTYEP